MSLQPKTIQIFKFSLGGRGEIEAGGDNSRPSPLYETLLTEVVKYPVDKSCKVPC